ncbi:DUF4384 domain-containing protein [Desulfococcaceae bacterium HSG8]|nr:DUF4384 domain-containing protein [Desulfococcaceae bacterium HSG8]
MKNRFKKMSVLACFILLFQVIAVNGETVPASDDLVKALTTRSGETEPSVHVAVPFDSDHYMITSGAVPWLNALGQAMTAHALREYIFEIRGHAAIPGSDPNRQLSLERAENVKAYLISNFRLSPDQIIAVEADDSEAGKEKSGVTVTNTGKKFAAASDRPFCKVEVKYLRGREITYLLPGETLTSRDNYSIHFTPDRSCYVYIFQADPLGDDIKMFFPNPDYSKKTNPVSGGKTYRIPEGAHDWLHVDKDKGNKEIIVLSNSEPLENPEELCRAALSGSGQVGSESFKTMNVKWKRKTHPTTEPDDKSDVIGDTVFTWQLRFNHQ